MEADVRRSSTFKSSVRNLKKHGILLHDGDDLTHIYEMASGTVKTTKMLADGRQMVIGFYGRGDIIGMPYETKALCSAEAVTDATLLCYPIKQIEDLMERSAKFYRLMLQLITKERYERVDHMVALGRKKPTERVASFLLKQKDTLPSEIPETYSVNLPMSQTDIADYLGLTQETVCRVLSQFKRQGFIKATHSHEIKIHSLTSLQATADVGLLH